MHGDDSCRVSLYGAVLVWFRADTCARWRLAKVCSSKTRLVRFKPANSMRFISVNCGWRWSNRVYSVRSDQCPCPLVWRCPRPVCVYVKMCRWMCRCVRVGAVVLVSMWPDWLCVLLATTTTTGTSIIKLPLAAVRAAPGTTNDNSPSAGKEEESKQEPATPAHWERYPEWVRPGRVVSILVERGARMFEKIARVLELSEDGEATVSVSMPSAAKQTTTTVHALDEEHVCPYVLPVSFVADCAHLL